MNFACLLTTLSVVQKRVGHVHVHNRGTVNVGVVVGVVGETEIVTCRVAGEAEAGGRVGWPAGLRPIGMASEEAVWVVFAVSQRFVAFGGWREGCHSRFNNV